MHESFLTSETLVFEVFVCVQAAVTLKWDDVKDRDQTNIGYCNNKDYR